MNGVQRWLGFLSITLFTLSGCSEQPSYDVSTSLQLCTRGEGAPLLDKVAEIKGYFLRGQPLPGSLVKVGVDKPTFSITTPRQIHDFFEAMWRNSSTKTTIPPFTDGLAFVVIMKDANAHPAYFQGYMTNGHLILLSPLTNQGSASHEAGELDKYLRTSFPDAAWLH